MELYRLYNKFSIAGGALVLSALLLASLGYVVEDSTVRFCIGIGCGSVALLSCIYMFITIMRIVSLACDEANRREAKKMAPPIEDATKVHLETVPVAMVEFAGTLVPGFITSTTDSPSGLSRKVTIFVPSSRNLESGTMCIYDEDDIIPLNCQGKILINSIGRYGVDSTDLVLDYIDNE